jgi:hypothetical protein
MRGRRYENRIAQKENAHRRDFMFVAPAAPDKRRGRITDQPSGDQVSGGLFDLAKRRGN